MNKEKLKQWILPALLGGLVILAVLNLMSKTRGLQVQLHFPNGGSLTAEVADSPEEHLMAFYAAGTLPRDKGVLIMYEESGMYPVWTRNLRAPVDIVWMGPTRKIVGIEENIAPCDSEPCPSIESETAVLFILQTQPGVARALGLEKGMAVRFTRVENGEGKGDAS
jgi:uncharacterized membrane protein (UPF0127 family)